MNRASVFEWHKRFKEARESVRDDERCGRSKEVNRPELTGQRVRVRVTMYKRLCGNGDPLRIVQETRILPNYQGASVWTRMRRIKFLVF